MQPDQLAVTEPLQDGAVYDELSGELGPALTKRLFPHAEAVRVDGTRLVLNVPSTFVRDWLQRQYAQVLVQLAKRLLGPDAEIAIHVDSTFAVPNPPPRLTATVPAKVAQPRSAPTHPAEDDPPSSQQAATQRSDTSDIVIGHCNELAHAAAQQVIKEPAGRANPLFLYGAVGVGKSLMLSRIRRQIQRQHHAKRMVCISAETFTNEFTRALSQTALPSFRLRYRSVDVLLVDDVDFLDGKRVIQEEFLHTVDELVGRQRQVVVTGGSHPRMLNRTSDELIARFLGGLVCRIGPPDESTRFEIVKLRARKLGLELPDAAAAEIAKRFRTAREIVGALNSLATYHDIDPQPITARMVRTVVSQLEYDCVRPIRIEQIEEVVCDALGVDRQDLASSRRARCIAAARQLAMYFAREHSGRALRDIGAHFGGRNHSTVVAAVRRVRTAIMSGQTVRVGQREIPYADLVDSLEGRLRAG